MPERFSPDDPREWLNRAQSNLAIAGTRADTSVYLEDLCFNAQQAAEKALKAVCILHHIEYPVVLQQRTDNRSRWIRPKISVIGLW
jgi:HEPN domain-containing protein